MKSNNINLLFLFFLVCYQNIIFSQAPGGVRDSIQLWLTPENYTNGPSWIDASGNARNATKIGTVSNANLYNFYNVPSNLNTVNYFSVTHNAKLNTSNGAISVFAVGLPGSTYAPFMAKTNNTNWDSGWILSSSSPRSDVGFTTGDWTGTGTINVAKQSGFSTIVPYIVSGFGNGDAINVISISNNGNTETTNNSSKTNSATDLTIGYDRYASGFGGGSIAEVIMYNRNLNATEKRQVQSYLAIKYGITLSQGNYLSSGNSPITIWDAFENNGYNNSIAGIGRDDSSNLYQKQSTSISSGPQVLIGLRGILANTNTSNTNTIQNGKFLVWGDNNKSKILSTPISGIVGVDYRFDAHWKVQNTGNFGTVRIAWPQSICNIKLIVSSDTNFTASDSIFNMPFTQIINGVTYNYVDADLPNGYFFTFLGRAPYGPGGVFNGLTSWFRTDNKTTGVITSGTGTLIDEMGNYSLTRNAGGNVVVFNGDSANFNYNKFLFFQNNGFLSRSSLSENDVFSVDQGSAYSVGLVPNGSFVHNIAGADKLSGTSVYATFNGRGQSFPSFNSTRPNIFGMNTSPTALLIGITNSTTSTSFLPPGQRMSGVYTLFMGNNAEPTPIYNNSRVSEAFSYNRLLSFTERSKVESYLAIKFGITLNLSHDSSSNYMLSNGTIIWNRQANVGYNNNIAAIARDDVSQLNQKQSRSMNNTNRYSNMLAIGLGNLASDNNNNSNSFSSNGDYIIWGDDNQVGFKTTEIPAELNPNGSLIVRRLNKEWKVRTSGMTNPVNMRFYLNTLVNSFSNIGTVKLLIDSDTNFANGGTTIISPTAFDNDSMIADFTNVVLPNGWYFTLVTDSRVAPGNVSSNLRIWLRADKGVSQSNGVSKWQDQSPNNLDAIQSVVAAGPDYKNNLIDNFNFNPVIRFNTSQFNKLVLPNSVLTAGSGSFTVYAVMKNRLDSVGFRLIGQTVLSFGTNTLNRGFNLGYYSGGGMFSMPNSQFNPMLTNGVDVVLRLPHILKYEFSGTRRQIECNNSLPTSTNTASFNLVPNVSNIGASMTDSFPFVGDIGELIIYESSITGISESQIQSYLAIKYGITMDLGRTNYIASNGSVVWNATSNALYKNRIFGIGNDIYSGLSQKQSRSASDPVGLLTVSLNTMAQTNSENVGIFPNDLMYTIFSDNNGSINESNSELPATVSPCSKRIGREWKVNITGNAMPVELRFDLNTMPISGSVLSDFKLLIDNDGDGNFGTGLITIVNASTYSGKVVTFSNVTFTNGQVFTLLSNDQEMGTATLTPPNTELTSGTYCTKNGWVNIYDPSDSSKRLFSVYPNGNTFIPSNVKINTGFGFTTADLNKADRLSNKAIALMQRMIQVTDATGGNDTIKGGMIVRFYYHEAEKTDAQNRMTQLRADSSITGNTSWNWFKSEKTIPQIISQLTGAGIGGPSRVWYTNPDSSGTEDGVTFAEFRRITEFSTFGGGQISGGNWNILPVKLLDFKASKRNTEAVLDWSTASEKNASHFVIERSSDAKTWNSIGRVKANGNTMTISKYQFVDASPLNGLNYYRLKTIDYDESEDSSKIVRVEFAEDSKINITVSPNPVHETIYVGINNSEKADLKLSIINILGETIYEDDLHNEDKNYTKTINRKYNWTSGMYWLRVREINSGKSAIKQIILK